MVMNYTKRIICQFNAVISFAGLVNQDGSNPRKTNVQLLHRDLKGSVGVWLKLASAKMAKVPTVVKTTKIQRNMRSTTMATYCQSSFSWPRIDG